MTSKLNLFIHHRDLRNHDNTTLIKQSKEEGNITPIFVFPPEQIDPKINEYFSNNLVQFMIQSLKELNTDYQKSKGFLYTFKGKYIKVLSRIHKDIGINSIGFNKDYSPYAKKRDKKIIKFCDKYGIKVYTEEDILLHDIGTGNGLTKSEEPYKVFTPFKKNLMKYPVRKVDNFKKFKYSTNDKLKNKYFFEEIDTLYTSNDKVLVKGGRKWALNRIKNLNKFKNYDECRNFLTYQTTLLSASINFNVISIRELYYKLLNKFGINNGIINELYWRDFYYNILFYFPHIIKGSFRKKYDNIKWDNNPEHFKAWKEGKTGFPIIDACMRQMNTVGYMHNRGRMIVSSFLVKNLLTDWRKGEKYFAISLIDYNISANNGGWQWSSGGGTDAQPYFRIFNPWTQAKKFDKECDYIKTWIPELKDVSNKDILNWDKAYLKYDIDYPKPIVDHSKTRKRALEVFKRDLN